MKIEEIERKAIISEKLQLVDVGLRPHAACVRVRLRRLKCLATARTSSPLLAECVRVVHSPEDPQDAVAQCACRSHTKPREATHVALTSS